MDDVDCTHNYMMIVPPNAHEVESVNLAQLLIIIADEIRTGNLYSFSTMPEDRFRVLQCTICNPATAVKKGIACLEIANKLITYNHFKHASILLYKGIQIICNEALEFESGAEPRPGLGSELDSDSGSDFGSDSMLYYCYYDCVLGLARLMVDGYLSEKENEMGNNLLKYLTKQFPQFPEASYYLC